MMDNINLDMIGRWINDGKSHLVLIACIHVSVCRRLLLVYAPREAHDVVHLVCLIGHQTNATRSKQTFI